jgi:hypothetical protein
LADNVRLRCSKGPINAKLADYHRATKKAPARGQLVVCSRRPCPVASKQIRPTLVVQSSSRLGTPKSPRTAGASRPRYQQPCKTLRSLLDQRSAGKEGGGRGGLAGLHCSALCLRSSLRAASWALSRSVSACASRRDAFNVGVGSSGGGRDEDNEASNIATFIEGSIGVIVRSSQDMIIIWRTNKTPNSRAANQ